MPQTGGVSLLLIYRDPDLYPAGAQALKTIVVYDGVHIQAPDEPTVQTIGGFLQSSLPPSVADAGVTIIAGSGAPNDTDRILFTNGELSDFSSTTTPIGADQFFRVSGGSSDRGWSSPTNPVGLLMPGTNNGNGFGEQVTVAVDHLNTSPYDCLATAAIVFSTNVEDADEDGLNDFLEANAGLMNPARVPYPDISLMGASPGQRDLFVEIGAMWSDGWNPATSGQDPTPGPHNHMPSEAILQTVADAFMNPPVGHEPIHLHFDVGDMAAPPDNPDLFVPAGLARGGEWIEEVVCVEDPETPETDCRFPGFAATTWPTGFHFLALAPVDEFGNELPDPNGVGWCPDPLPGASNDPDDCRRRFDLNRQGVFHYLLYAHARATPKSAFPCLLEGVPVAFEDEAAQTCAAGAIANLEYFIPKSVSGVAELPSRYGMVSLGLWDNFVGTEFMQKAATLHEIVHNLGGWHGGATPTFTTTYRPTVFVQPNCKPFYFSSISYLFEAAGVLDASGVPQVRLSAEATNLNEESLADGAFSLPFRPAWYSPIEFDASDNPTTLAAVLGVPPAKKFCNGALFGLNPPSPPMGRLDATLTPGLSWSVDWAGDGDGSGAPQDVNFDGAQTGDLANLVGFSDWPGLRLNQPGAGRNMEGMSVGQGLDFGGLDFGGVELDFDTIIESGGTPPNQLEVCVLGESTGFACAPAENDPLHRHRLNWSPPTVGTVDAGGYEAFRFSGATLTPTSVIDFVDATGPATTTVDDLQELAHGETVTYFVRASVAGEFGGPSNLTTVVAENAPPVANADSYSTDQDTALVVPAATGVLSNDTDVDSASLTAALDAPPAHGALTLNPADGSFIYTPGAGFAGTDTFTYAALDVTPISAANVAATVTIEVIKAADITPPVVTLTVPAPPTGQGGFFNASNVPVVVGVSATDSSNVSSFTCTDNGSPIAVGSLSGIGSPAASGTLNLGGDGPHSLACIATDSAEPSNSGAAGGSVNTGTVKIDTTAPTIVGSRSPGANINGWNNTAVTVSFACADDLSGLAAGSPPADTVLSDEGAGQFVDGSCFDQAGNSASATVSGINIDTTAPTIAGSRSPGANINGWNNTAVTVSFACADPLSGLAGSPPADTVLSDEGAGQFVDGSCFDQAGNSASATVSGINIDTTAPTIAGSRSPGANINGWNNTAVTVSFACADPLSGLAGSPPADTVLSDEGAGQFVDGSCFDQAGNSASATVSGINIDTTAPTIAGSRSPGANINGWNNTAVTVSFACADPLSGLAGSPPADTVLSDEGAGQFVDGSCFDQAGNSASATVSGINIDATAPNVTATADPGTIWSPNGKKVTVTVSGKVTDTGSGVVPASGTFSVLDEYDQDQPSGMFTIAADGNYSFDVQLTGSRRGSDGDGRLYTITVGAKDAAGNAGLAEPPSITVHDQSGPNGRRP